MDWGTIAENFQRRLDRLGLTNLASRIVLWSFLPTALILAAVAGATFLFYLQAAEELAVTQNSDLARYASGQLAADLDEYSDLLQEVSRLSGLGLVDHEQWEQALLEQSNRLVVFRGGVIALDQEGVVTAAEPDRPDLLNQNLSDRGYFRDLVRNSGPAYSDVVYDGVDNGPVVAISIRIIGPDGSMRGVLVGFFRLGETAVSAFYGDIIKLRPGGEGQSYLVDGQGMILFHSQPNLILEQRMENPAVGNALLGEMGAIRVTDEGGLNVLASYAPVPATDWGLIIEQPWASVVAPVRSQEVLLITLFLLGVLVPGYIVTRGVRRITKPVVDLVESATRIASGEYDSAEVPSAEGELGELAAQFTEVAAQLRTAHEELEQRVQARTKELSMVLEAIQDASSSLDLDQVLHEIAEALAEAARVSHCVIFLLDEQSGQLLPAESWHKPDTKGGLQAILKKPIDPSQDQLTARVVETARPVVSADPTSALIRRSNLSSVLEVPLASKGQVLAVAVLGSNDPNREFSQAEVDLAWGMATTAAVAIENAQLYMEIQDKVREVEGLYQADEELHRHLELEAVLQSLVDVSVDILGADKSSILEWDDHEQVLRLRAARGFHQDTLDQMIFGPGEGAIGQVAVDRETRIAEDTRALEQVDLSITEAEGIRAFMHIPVDIGGTFFGVFNVDFLEPRTFRREEVRAFTALAKRAALAIENARLYEQSRELAVYEERQRLARDLHDAVTQTLFSASLTAEVLPKIWERDQAEGARRLEELRMLTRGALAEMRTLLLELRPTTLIEADFEDLMGQLAEAIASRAGVEVNLEVEGSCPMPAEVKVAVYRVAQEALNNIAKHAQAQAVDVMVKCHEKTGLTLQIKDDGKGIEEDKVHTGHLGLGIMQERAKEIGAELIISSEPGAGTHVQLTWQPDGSEENLNDRDN